MRSGPSGEGSYETMPLKAIMSDLTVEEKAFVESVKPRVEEFLRTRTERDIDIGVGSILLSENGNIYHGVPFIVARTVHGEENAIGSMVTEEGIDARIKMILIVGGADDICMPCGMCRVAIYRHSTESTSVLCGNLSLSDVRKFTISELYPHPWRGEE